MTAAVLPGAPTWLIGPASPTPPGMIDSATLCRETGLTYRQLDYAIRALGWRAGGSGSKRVFDTAWLPVFRRLAGLLTLRERVYELASCWSLACELSDDDVTAVLSRLGGEA